MSSLQVLPPRLALPRWGDTHSSCSSFSHVTERPPFPRSYWSSPSNKQQELRAAFGPGVPEAELPLAWGNLSHALSGLMCASLNFLARPEATAPQALELAAAAANSEGGGGGDSHGSGGGALPRAARLRRLYASLPKEAVCTENLTPALKLLPCRDQAGAAALLLSRPAVFGADYHSLRLRVAAPRQRARGGAPRALELSLSVSLVLRPPAGGGGASPGAWRPAPRPRSYSGWRLSELFGAELKGTCPVAAASRLLVQLPPQLAAGGGSGADALLRGPPSSGGGAARAAEWATPAFTLTPAPDGVVVGNSSGGGGGGGGGSGDAFYVYDLKAMEAEARRSGRQQQQQQQQQEEGEAERRGQEAADDEAEADGRLPALDVSQSWAPEAAKGAAVAAAARPSIRVARYTTGQGFMRGAMTLRLSAADEAAGLGGAYGSSTDSSSSGSSSSSGGSVTVCVFQVVPWYVRLWLHTLRLTVDGAPADLDGALLLRHVAPAADRARPLALELCLALPARAREAALEAQFSKAFLHVFEWPPDAHRGFDVPAAVVTYAEARGGGGGGGGWRWTGGSSSSGGGGNDSPLLAASVAAARPLRALYSAALLVPLAPPDFSMPYNVVCLTSTVLAVYIGAALNALLKRPGQELRDARDARAGAAAARRKAAKVVVVLVLFGGLALYVDEELRGQAAKLLNALGLEGALVGIAPASAAPAAAS